MVALLVFTIENVTKGRVSLECYHIILTVYRTCIRFQIIKTHHKDDVKEELFVFLHDSLIP